MVGIVMETPSIRSRRQNCFANSAAFFLPRRHIYRTAIPCMFERKRHDFLDTDESQPEFNISTQILEPGLRNRLKSNLVTLPSNERDKCLLDVERGAVALTVERKQHIALTTEVEQLLQLVWAREIPHRYPMIMRSALWKRDASSL